jgi:hypothetical protein
MSNGGDGGTAGGSGIGSIQQAAETLSQLQSTLDTISKIIDDLGSFGLGNRSVVCEIDNVCRHALNFDSSNFDHGEFGPDLPPASVADKSSGLFGAGSSGFLTGVEGRVFYTIDDGVGSRLTVHFDNPEVGSNSGDCNVDSVISNRYFTKAIIGGGNNGARMRYILGQLNGPFSLRTFLNNAMPSGFDPNAPIISIRGLQPPVTSIRSLMRV